MRQVRKPKPAARSRLTADKPARNRRSAEQMLVELKLRLREISDLNAAGDVLNWDQATYMPEGGAGARGRQLATLQRLGHERAVAPGARHADRRTRSPRREPALRLRRRESDPCRTPRISKEDQDTTRPCRARNRAHFRVVQCVVQVILSALGFPLATSASPPGSATMTLATRCSRRCTRPATPCTSKV
jgi:Carboxypeptidase Taq (M32) metallopeptidase